MNNDMNESMDNNMESHNFDSAPTEPVAQKNTDNGGFDIYAKSYTPTESGYAEERRRYSVSEPPIPERKPKKRRGGTVAVAVIVTLALMLTGLAGVAVSAMVALDRYEDRYEALLEKMEGDEPLGGDESEKPSDVPSVETETERETERELIFSSDEETKIDRSDSPAVTVDGAVGDADLSVADVAALVADSVVEITTSETLRNGLVYESGAGSGVIVNASGVIITNHHVVEAATNILVRLTNGNTYEATVVATDAESDIAILKISPKETLCVAVRGDSDKLVVGEAVLAIGNPLGVLGGTVTNGIISALEREVTIDGVTMTLLQHNAAISPGNSGGALFNMRGELIGIVNAKSSSSGAEGLGFAIPMNTVMEVYDDLIAFGYVKGRADHGLVITTDRYYLFYGYLYIYSSRYTDELRYGDRLVAIDGRQPTTVDEAYAMLSAYEIGDTAEIVVIRNNKQVTVELTIREYAPQ